MDAPTPASFAEFARAARVFVVEPTFYDLAAGELDAEKICDDVAGAFGNCIRLGVHSHQGHAYWPSAIAPTAPGIGEVDIPARFIAAAKARQLRLAFYINTICNPTLAPANPAWRQRDTDGEPRRWGWLDVLCVNSGYGDYLLDLVAEFVQRYQPECIYLDNLCFPAPCTCQSCRDQFRQAAGADLPHSAERDPGRWAKYQQWRSDSAVAAARRIVARARAERDDIFVMFNGCYYAQKDNHLGWRPDDVAPFAGSLHSEFAMRWYGHAFERVDLIAAHQRALGIDGWTWVEYAPMPWTLQACPEAELRLKTARVVAVGSTPTVWTLTPMPPASDRGLPALGKVFGILARHPEVYQARQAVASVCVVHCQNAWRLPDRARAAAERCDLTLEAVAAALTRQHVPWELQFDGRLTDELLDRYDVVVLPSTPVIEPRLRDSLKDYVRRGGGLLALEGTGMWSPRGRPLNDSALAKPLGVHIAPRPAPDDEADLISRTGAYLRFRGDPQPMPSFPGDTLLPCASPLTATTLSTAFTMADLVPAPFYYAVLPREQPTEPGLTINVHGEGMAVYVGTPVHDMIPAQRHWGFVEAERLVAELVRHLAQRPMPIDLDAPRTVSLHPWRRGHDLYVVHLTHAPTDTSTLIDRVAEVPQVQLRLRLPQGRAATSVDALVEPRRIDWHQDDDIVTVTVERLDIHQIIVIRTGG